MNFIERADRWNTLKLSSNPNITWKYVRNNPHKKWSWALLSSNLLIPLEKIAKYNTVNWDWERVSKRSDINIDVVFKYQNIIRWNWRNITMNKGIKWEDITNNPTLPWNTSYMIANPNVTPEILINNINIVWCWEKYTYNTNLDWKFALMIYHYLDWMYIFGHYSVNWSVIQNIPPNLVPWGSLSTRKDIDWTVVYDTSDNDWLWGVLSKHESLPIDIVLALPEKNWNWRIISARTIVTPEIVNSYPNLPWDSKNISVNPNFDLHSYHDIDLDLYYLFNRNSDLLAVLDTPEYQKKSSGSRYNISNSPLLTSEIVKKHKYRYWSLLDLVTNWRKDNIGYYWADTLNSMVHYKSPIIEHH
jgi:hypothetical protein